jgi:ribosomal protein L44E
MLRCEECGKQARTEKEARRWRAYLTVVDEDEPEEVVVYCPDCAKREFEAAVLTSAASATSTRSTCAR